MPSGKDHGRGLLDELADWARSDPWRVPLLVLSLGLVSYVAFAANAEPPPGSYVPLLLLWGAGIFVFVSLFIPRVRTWHSPDSRTLILLGGLGLVALLLRAWRMEYIPANFGGDEGTQGMAAVDVLEGELKNPFRTGWYAVPTMSFFVQALSLRLFGDNVAGLRMISAIVGALTVPFTFLILRDFFGFRIGLMGALLLAFGHYHLHFSRLGSNQIADALFAVLMFYFLNRALSSGRDRDFVLTGLVLGGSLYGYFGAKAAGVIMVCYLGTLLLGEEDFWRRYRRGLFFLTLCALLVALPLLFYYREHPGDIRSRYNQVGIFPSGWLAQEQEVTGKGMGQLLWQQFWKSILAFNSTRDPTFWYRAQIPLLDFISGIFFVLGFVWTTLRCRDRRYRLLTLWFWMAIIIGWMLTEDPPSSQRMLIVTPVVAGMVAIGIDRLLILLREFFPESGHVENWFLVIVLLGSIVLNIRYYFAEYTPSRVYGNPTAEIGTVLGRYLDRLEDGIVYHFYAPPRMYAGFGTLRFLARDVQGIDVPPLDEGAPPGEPRPDLIVVLKEREADLATIQAGYPGGRLRAFYSTGDHRLMFWIYDEFD
ncbi:MAG: glycosyltransferase family 39 protein [Anaerolineae bacterium]